MVAGFTRDIGKVDDRSRVLRRQAMDPFETGPGKGEESRLLQDRADIEKNGDLIVIFREKAMALGQKRGSVFLLRQPVEIGQAGWPLPDSVRCNHGPHR